MNFRWKILLGARGSKTILENCERENFQIGNEDRSVWAKQFSYNRKYVILNT